VRHWVALLVLCGWVVISQHRGSDGALWYRGEAGPMSVEACRALLKTVTTRSRVGLIKWYDATPQQLTHHFGHDATPTLGSWLACWPEGAELGLGASDQ